MSKLRQNHYRVIDSISKTCFGILKIIEDQAELIKLNIGRTSKHVTLGSNVVRRFDTHPQRTLFYPFTIIQLIFCVLISVFLQTREFRFVCLFYSLADAP